MYQLVGDPCYFGPNLGPGCHLPRSDDGSEVGLQSLGLVSSGSSSPLRRWRGCAESSASPARNRTPDELRPPLLLRLPVRVWENARRTTRARGPDTARRRAEGRIDSVGGETAAWVPGKREANVRPPAATSSPRRERRRHRCRRRPAESSAAARRWTRAATGSPATSTLPSTTWHRAPNLSRPSCRQPDQLTPAV